MMFLFEIPFLSGSGCFNDVNTIGLKSLVFEMWKLMDTTHYNTNIVPNQTRFWHIAITS